MISIHSSWHRFDGRKVRHPLLRVLCALLGVVLLGVLLALGLIAGLVMISFGLLRRALTRRPVVASASTGSGAVIDGEYRVVHHAKASLAR